MWRNRVGPWRTKKDRGRPGGPDVAIRTAPVPRLAAAGAKRSGRCGRAYRLRRQNEGTPGRHRSGNPHRSACRLQYAHP